MASFCMIIDMEFLYAFLVAWLMSSTALGVGSSTLAIAGFLVALKDGQIDESERRMLGVIYYALRVAMGMIALSLLGLGLLYPGAIVSTPMIWLLLAVLLLNSLLMTKHWISFRLGPALQAATWYTLGFVLVIEAFSLVQLTYFNFALLYVADIAILLAIVNLLLSFYLPKKS